MLCEHESILKLNDFDNSQWITFAVVNLSAILFVRFGLPIIKRFIRESRLFDEEIVRRFRRFYYAKFGPHFMSRSLSPEMVIGTFLYIGLISRWLLTCPVISKLSFLLAGLTLVMWKIELLRRLFNILRRFVNQNGLSSPNIDRTSGMPPFQPDLMEKAMSELHSDTKDRTPASRDSSPYIPRSSVMTK